MTTQPTRLIRRDLPLDPGRRLTFRFTVEYDVTLDDNLLDMTGFDDVLEPATLAEIEQRLGDGDESILRTLQENYDRGLVEFTAHLVDADDGDRFELGWERESRLLGHEFRFREWLDEIPPARPTVRPDQCITLLTVQTGEAYCERRRGHDGIHTAIAVRTDTLPRATVIGEPQEPARMRKVIEGEAEFMERVGRLLWPLIVQIKAEIDR